MFVRYRPKGLLLLSGDVHFAELLTTRGRPGEAVEMTTSGMTHSCSHTAMGMCEMAVRTYNRHRTTPEDYFTGWVAGR
jgi:hypothetical protein